MNNNWNPNGELFDRPIPPGLLVDVSGLVEAWVAEAEDWLMAYSGIDSLTAREAFEGIECWGRLARCSRELLQISDGTAAAEQLENTIAGEACSIFCTKAIEFPSLSEWLEQAQSVWDVDSDDSEITSQLLTDLDAADYLSWFASRIDEQSDTFEDELSRCHQWLREHALMFILSEPLVRAIAKTFSNELDSTDPTGCLAFSTIKYMTLLDCADAAWEDSIAKPNLSIGKNQPAYGHKKHDWSAEPLAAMAASNRQIAKSVKPMLWQDSKSKFQATTYLPDVAAPDGSTSIEISFGAEAQFIDPATELIGAHVRLGGAEGVIQARSQGGADFVYVSLRYSEVVHVSGSYVEQFVNGAKWK